MRELTAVAFRTSGIGTMELARYRVSPLKRIFTIVDATLDEEMEF